MIRFENLQDPLAEQKNTSEIDFDKRVDSFATENEKLKTCDVDDRMVVDEWSDFKYSDLFTLSEVLHFFDTDIFKNLSMEEKGIAIDMLRDKVVEDLHLI